jgi:cytosine/uracil/thiamine/allantoin permease
LTDTVADLKGNPSSQLSPARLVLRGALSWGTFGAFAAVLSITLVAVLSKHQMPWFYAAWFITLVLAATLLGTICTLCTCWLAPTIPDLKEARHDSEKAHVGLFSAV